MVTLSIVNYATGVLVPDGYTVNVETNDGNNTVLASANTLNGSAIFNTTAILLGTTYKIVILNGSTIVQTSINIISGYQQTIPYSVGTSSGGGGSSTGSTTISSSVNPTGASNFTPGQVTIQTSATLVCAARTGRISFTLVNNSTNIIYIGNSSVTSSTGLILPAGASVTLQTSVAIYAISPSAASQVSYYELY